jgi:(p)ppGpp synthase/HD superfamily hydrolase
VLTKCGNSALRRTGEDETNSPMNLPSLEEAIALALERHSGKKDKGGAAYILHPLRVMLAVEGDDARRVAVLHDLVEDTATTLDELRARGYPEAEIAALDALSRRKDESYEGFIERVAGNALACYVKLADLADNMDVRRLPAVDEHARERLERYRRAWRRLREKPIPNGIPERLYIYSSGNA